MRFVQPIAVTFVIAAVGAAVIGMRPGWPVGTILVGATLAAAATGLVASFIQFLPDRLFLPFTILAGAAVALLVSAGLHAIESIGFGPVRSATVYVWPIAAVVALLISRATGMRLPRPRRGRPLPR